MSDLIMVFIGSILRFLALITKICDGEQRHQKKSATGAAGDTFLTQKLG